MKKFIYFILATLCLLLTLTACQTSPDSDFIPEEPAVTEPEETPEPEPELDSALSQRDRDWIEDIEYLRTEYKARHLDPFYLVSEAEFDWKVEQLISKVDQLSDEDMYFEIRALVAGMGDTHTYVSTPESLYDRQFPIGARYFGDKLYLTVYLEGYEQFAPYLLHEIVAVNGIDITYLEQKAASLFNPFNHWLGKEGFSYFFLPAFFDWAGCDYKEGYTIEILNDNREVESIEAPLITSEDVMNGTRVRHENWDALFSTEGKNWVGYYDGENGGYIYMSLARLPFSAPSSLWLLAIEVNKQREAHPECGKLVVDLRLCPGGDGSDLVAFEENIEMLRMEQVYVLTSGYSASAATITMAFFKQELGAVLVGEPTGQFPYAFHLSSSWLEPAVLPHSQIIFTISDHLFDPEEVTDWAPVVEAHYDEDGKLYPWENTILPDVYVYQDIDDIRQGKDSVLEWVLAQ